MSEWDEKDCVACPNCDEFFTVGADYDDGCDAGDKHKSECPHCKAIVRWEVCWNFSAYTLDHTEPPTQGSEEDR